MNIGFYDPISERWIKPRPEKEPEAEPSISLGEALLNATEAAAVRERNEKIWQYLKQTAEGCNAPSSAPAVPEETDTTGCWYLQSSEFYYLDGAGIKPLTETAPLIVVEAPPEYEAVESLGYIYWKPKVTI